MKIPMVTKTGRQKYPNIKKMDIKVVKIKKGDIPEITYIPELDIDDEKQMKKYCLNMRMKIRSSKEYRDLMSFLKEHRHMNSCFYFPNIKKFKGKKISIEIHHLGVPLYDIIDTVVRKKFTNRERYDYLAVCKEIMELHFRGSIGLVPVSKTIHQLLHAEDTDLFIPLQHALFGNMIEFYTEYNPYMKKELKKKFDTYQVLSTAFDRLDEIIPDYLNPSAIYYEVEGVELVDFEELLKIVSA